MRFAEPDIQTLFAQEMGKDITVFEKNARDTEERTQGTAAGVDWKAYGGSGPQHLHVTLQPGAKIYTVPKAYHAYVDANKISSETHWFTDAAQDHEAPGFLDKIMKAGGQLERSLERSIVAADGNMVSFTNKSEDQAQMLDLNGKWQIDQFVVVPIDKEHPLVCSQDMFLMGIGTYPTSDWPWPSEWLNRKVAGIDTFLQRVETDEQGIAVLGVPGTSTHYKIPEGDTLKIETGGIVAYRGNSPKMGSVDGFKTLLSGARGLLDIKFEGPTEVWTYTPNQHKKIKELETRLAAVEERLGMVEKKAGERREP